MEEEMLDDDVDILDDDGGSDAGAGNDAPADDVDRKIAEEYSKYKEERTSKQQNRPSTAPPFIQRPSEPTSADQRRREVERSALQARAPAPALTDSARQPYKPPPQRPASAHATAPTSRSQSAGGVASSPLGLYPLPPPPAPLLPTTPLASIPQSPGLMSPTPAPGGGAAPTITTPNGGGTEGGSFATRLAAATATAAPAAAIPPPPIPPPPTPPGSVTIRAYGLEMLQKDASPRSRRRHKASGRFAPSAYVDPTRPHDLADGQWLLSSPSVTAPTTDAHDGGGAGEAAGEGVASDPALPQPPRSLSAAAYVPTSAVPQRPWAVGGGSRSPAAPPSLDEVTLAATLGAQITAASGPGAPHTRPWSAVRPWHQPGSGGESSTRAVGDMAAARSAYGGGAATTTPSGPPRRRRPQSALAAGGAHPPIDRLSPVQRALASNTATLVAAAAAIAESTPQPPLPPRARPLTATPQVVAVPPTVPHPEWSMGARLAAVARLYAAHDTRPPWLAGGQRPAGRAPLATILPGGAVELIYATGAASRDPHRGGGGSPLPRGSRVITGTPSPGYPPPRAESAPPRQSPYEHRAVGRHRGGARRPPVVVSVGGDAHPVMGTHWAQAAGDELPRRVAEANAHARTLGLSERYRGVVGGGVGPGATRRVLVEVARGGRGGGAAATTIAVESFLATLRRLEAAAKAERARALQAMMRMPTRVGAAY